MASIIIRNTEVGRRASIIDADEAAAMVKAGRAKQHNAAIFEEIETPEPAVEYARKDMAAATKPSRKATRDTDDAAK